MPKLKTCVCVSFPEKMFSLVSEFLRNLFSRFKRSELCVYESKIHTYVKIILRQQKIIRNGSVSSSSRIISNLSESSEYGDPFRLHRERLALKAILIDIE